MIEFLLSKYQVGKAKSIYLHEEVTQWHIIYLPDNIIKQVTKDIRLEMKYICNDAIICEATKGVKCFKWCTLFHKLSEEVSTLIRLLSSLNVGKNNKKY